MTPEEAQKTMALKSEDYAGFAQAMLSCQDRSGSCISTSICSHDWECFGPGSILDARRHLDAVSSRLTAMTVKERKQLIKALGRYLPEAKIINF